MFSNISTYMPAKQRQIALLKSCQRFGKLEISTRDRKSNQEITIRHFDEVSFLSSAMVYW